MRNLLIKSCLYLTPQSISHRLAGEFVPVFMLHRVADSQGEYDDCKISQLNDYLEYIRKHHYQPISLQKLFDYLISDQPLPKRAVVFTMDDGFEDQFECLSPVFTRYDVPLTCFVITDFLQRKLWPWDDQVKYIFYYTKLSSFSVRLPDETIFKVEVDNDDNRVIQRRRLIEQLKAQNQTHMYKWLHTLYQAAQLDTPATIPDEFAPASWEQVNQFVRTGHAVAPHSKTHRILSRLDDVEVLDEIIGSYEFLKTRVECADIFAYPTGQSSDFGNREKDIIKSSPMSGSVTTVIDAARPGYPLEAVPRFSLPDNMGDFLQTLSFIEVLKNKVRGIGPG
jgi:peptidoglycan/xylan/chitin deacetylase (PgdA/CDA1 family)